MVAETASEENEHYLMNNIGVRFVQYDLQTGGHFFIQLGHKTYRFRYRGDETREEIHELARQYFHIININPSSTPDQ